MTTQETITEVYQRLLGRVPDPEGLAYWTTQIDTNGMPIAEFAFNVRNSTEYINRQAALSREVNQQAQNTPPVDGQSTVAQDNSLGLTNLPGWVTDKTLVSTLPNWMVVVGALVAGWVVMEHSKSAGY